MLEENRSPLINLLWLFYAAIALFWVLTWSASADPTVSDSPRLQRLVTDVQSGDTAAEGRFWQAVKEDGLPMIEASSGEGRVTMTFLLKAGAEGLDPRNARVAMMVPERPLYPFKPVTGTSLWSVTLEVSDKAMGMYWFAWPRGRKGHGETVFDLPFRDGIHYEFFADPYARKTIKGTIQPQHQDKVMSIFFATPDQELPYSQVRDGVARGQLFDHTIDSAAFGTPRKVSVYLPDGYSQKCGHPWVLVFDAENYLSLMSANAVFDNLIAEKAIPPIGAVFVHTGASRVPDLAPNPSMEGYVREELVPWVRETYGFSRDSQDTAVMGFSHGGLAAFNAALKNPDLIGAVISHASSAWWSSTLKPPFSLLSDIPAEAGELARSFAEKDKMDLRFYMDVGSWEGKWQVNTNKQLHAVLVDKGYSASFRTYEGGHDYLAWREMLPGALMEIFTHEPKASECQ